MIQIQSISDYKVLCKIKTILEDKSERYIDSEILLHENLEVKALGVKGDILITPEDLEAKDLDVIQVEINRFLYQQSKLELDLTKKTGCFYKIKNTVLYFYPDNDNKTIDDSQWSEVCELKDMQIINLINNFFKTHFEPISFRP